MKWDTWGETIEEKAWRRNIEGVPTEDMSSRRSDEGEIMQEISCRMKS